jgi:hypothetical protein
MHLHKQRVDADGDRRARERLNRGAVAARLLARPPGRCTLCVASNTTGAPNPRSIGKPAMSTTSVL